MASGGLTLRAGHVEFPADPHQREAVAHQQAVAEMFGLHRIGRCGAAIEGASAVPCRRDSRSRTAPIPEARAGSCGARMKRSAENSTRPARIARREIDIGDRLVMRIGRIELEENGAGDLLVGPGRAEPLAVGDHGARGDRDAGDVRPGRLGQRRDEAARQEQSAGEVRHPRRLTRLPRYSVRSPR